MKRRRKMSRKHNHRNFRRGTKVNRKNARAMPMRGGFRI